MRQIVFIVVLILISGAINAQVDKEFWFVGPELAEGHGDRPIYIRISTMEDTANIILRMPANLSFTPITQQINPNTTFSINLTPWIDIIENKPANQILNNGLLLTSDKVVTAYYECAHPNNPGIFSMKGKNAKGTDFYIVSQNDYYNQVGQESFDIVATEDNTTVTIIPSDDIVGHNAGIPFTVTLNKGQTYSARALYTTAPRTLSGSKITADKPIAISWQDDSIRQGSAYDVICDQIIPNNILGLEYIAIRGYANTNERIYVCGTKNNTLIWIDGNPTPVATIQAGELFKYQLPGGNNTAYLESSEPVHVLHLSGYNNEFGGSILPQDSCTGSSQIGFNRTNNNTFALLILTRSGNEGSFLVNGSAAIITATDFSLVPGTGNAWVYARKQLTTAQVPVGPNLIQNTMGKFHLGILHQTGASAEYGYFSDFSSLYLGADANICPNDSMILDGGANMTTYIWQRLVGGTWIQVGANRFYTVHDSGYYACNVNGNFCTLMDTIHIGFYPGATVTLGPDTSICIGTSITFDPGLFVYYLWNTGYTGRQLTADTGGVYWVGVVNNNNCIGYDTILLSIDSLPLANQAILGPDTVCQGQAGVIYSVDSLRFATSYSWTLPPGANGSSDSSEIVLDFAHTATSGQLKVRGLNECGDGPDTSFVINVKLLPLASGGITGPDTVCQTETGVMFTAQTIPNALSYTWILPPGASLISGAGTNSIQVSFSSTASSGSILVFGENTCGYGDTTVFPLVVKSLPATAGSITGTTPVCQYQSGVTYSITPVQYATSYIWSYSGNGATIFNNGSSASIGFSTTATGGILTVKGQNACGFGPVSPGFTIQVNPKPDVSLQICQTITSRNAQPFVLKGGVPLGGNYSGTGVSGGWFTPSTVPLFMDSVTVTYSYTNLYNCPYFATQKIVVLSAPVFTCGDSLTDIRDHRKYPTVAIGSQCWMAANLNYGTMILSSLHQRDNCIPEKYCYNDLTANCQLHTAYYQWDEVMQYAETPGLQGLCPPGWHIPTEGEWNTLFTFYISNGFAGSPLKSSGYSGFHALLSGIRFHNSIWKFPSSDPVLRSILYWSSTVHGPYKAWAHGMNEVAADIEYTPSVSFYPALRSNGFAVRCMKD
ncbi:MAG: FISUMP domain-containing protein [bacterium]